jgi:cell division protein FtsN
MPYPVVALMYTDVDDPTQEHGLEQDAVATAVVLNPRPGEDQLLVVNLGEVVPRVLVESEPSADAAMPHQVHEWAKKLDAALTQAQSHLETLRKRAYEGKVSAHENASEDPDVTRVAAAAGKARQLAKLLSDVGRSQGAEVKPLQAIVDTPASILSADCRAKVMPTAEAIASKS